MGGGLRAGAGSPDISCTLHYVPRKLGRGSAPLEGSHRPQFSALAYCVKWLDESRWHWRTLRPVARQSAALCHGISGVAGSLAAWCGGQICRPIVLGFGKWIACLKPRVLMPKVTCSIYTTVSYPSLPLAHTSVLVRSFNRNSSHLHP